MDTPARALIVAAAMLHDGVLTDVLAERYASWDQALGRSILAGERSLEDLFDRVVGGSEASAPVSGHQEALEREVTRYLETAR